MHTIEAADNNTKLFYWIQRSHSKRSLQKGDWLAVGFHYGCCSDCGPDITPLQCDRPTHPCASVVSICAFAATWKETEAAHTCALAPHCWDCVQRAGPGWARGGVTMSLCPPRSLCFWNRSISEPLGDGQWWESPAPHWFSPWRSL